MFRIRQASASDVDQVLAVAEHLDTVNLPAQRAHIEGIVDRAVQSFAGNVPAVEREFLFVLEDLAHHRIIGTSMIYAQHGTKRAPHIFFRVENDERYSYTLDRYFVHQTLRIGYNYNGPTEIGGLILLPEYRRNSESLGKALSFVRFLFIKMNRSVFRDQVLSELLPPLDVDGHSRLWEHLGRHFTGLSYQEADLLSKDNKEFIHALFPDDPIHTELLPEDVRKIIGQVGEETKGVEKMLRRIGFSYAGQIDPFDGGPHFMAATDEIAIVKHAQALPVCVVPGQPADAKWAILATTVDGKFFATGAQCAVVNGELALTADTTARLGISAGHQVWMAFG